MKKLFDSFKKRDQDNLESMKGCECVFHYIDLLCYKCHKTNPNHRVSYIDSPDCIKNKKATINPTKKIDNKCFQYTVAVVLSHEKIRKNNKNQTIYK